jgi:hypothetical protein
VKGTPSLAETSLTARLAAWTVAQGITPADSPAALADRLVASLGPAYVSDRLDSGMTGYLRGAAERYADPEPVSDGQWVAEDYRHGHGPKPRKQARRGNG